MNSKIETMADKTEQKLSITKREGETTKETTVEPIENGYLVTIYESGYKKRKDGDGNEYYSETKKFFSETNPLKESSKEEKKGSKEDEDSDDSKSVLGAIKNFMGPLAGHTLID